MMTQQEIKDKAAKIAARMQSPYPHEAQVAANMLRKLLDDYNLSMQDVGLSSHDVSIYSHKTASTAPEFRIKDIKEVVWKKKADKNWEGSMVSDLCDAFDAASIRDSAGYIRLIGFPAELAVVTAVLSNLHKFVLSQLEGHSFRNELEQDSFAIGMYREALKQLDSSMLAKRISDTKRKLVFYYVYVTYQVKFQVEKGRTLNSEQYRNGKSHGQAFKMESAPSMSTSSGSSYRKLR